MTNQNQKLSCFICGTWIKSNSKEEYQCPHCKAKWIKDKFGNWARIYDNYRDYIEN